MRAKIVWIRKGLSNFFRHVIRIVGIGETFQQDDKFIAAQARNHVGFANRISEATARDLT